MRGYLAHTHRACGSVHMAAASMAAMSTPASSAGPNESSIRSPLREAMRAAREKNVRYA